MSSQPVEWWRPAAVVRPLHGPSALAPGSRAPFAALLVFTALVIAAPQEFISVLGRLRVVLVTAIVAIATHLLDRRARAASSGIPLEVVLVGCLVGWAILTIPESLWPTGTITSLLDLYLKSVIVFWLVGRIVSTVSRIRTILWTLTIAAVPAALTAIWSYSTGSLVKGRIAGYEGGLASNPNDLALTLNLVIPLTVALIAISRRLVVRCVGLLLLALNVTAVVATFSRAGFVTLSVISLMFLMELIRRRAWRITVVVILSAVIGLSLLPDSYVERLATITHPATDSTHSAQDRWRDIVAAIRFVAQHPLSGAGVGMDVLALNQQRGRYWIHVHNAYLMIAVDLGVIGLLLFIALVVISIRNVGRLGRRLAADVHTRELSILASGVRTALCGFAVAALFYPIAYHFYFYYLAGLGVAVQATARRVTSVVVQHPQDTTASIVPNWTPGALSA